MRVFNKTKGINKYQKYRRYLGGNLAFGWNLIFGLNFWREFSFWIGFSEIQQIFQNPSDFLESSEIIHNFAGIECFVCWDSWRYTLSRQIPTHCKHQVCWCCWFHVQADADRPSHCTSTCSDLHWPSCSLSKTVSSCFVLMDRFGDIWVRALRRNLWATKMSGLTGSDALSWYCNQATCVTKGSMTPYS